MEVLGDAIIPVLKAISSDFLKDKWLAEYNLDNIVKGEYYSQQDYLNLLQRIHEKMSMLLKQAGEKVYSEVEIPPEIETVEQALMLLDAGLYMNHRGGDTGHYDVELYAPNQFLLTCDTPYPCEMSIGIVTGIGTAFGKMIIINHHDEQCRSKGDDVCVYRLRIV